MAPRQFRETGRPPGKIGGSLPSVTLVDLPTWLVVGTAVALGLAFGSFLNVVIHRLPRGESLSHPPSQCPACGTPIRVRDNIPVFGWLMLRGRARCCGAQISPRYPLVELLGGLSGWAVAERVVLQLPADTAWYLLVASFAVHLALVLGLIAAVFIDLEHMLLPDEITVGGTILGLASVPLRGITWQESLVGAALGYGLVWLLFIRLYQAVRGVAGMGLGDAKLLMLAGAWFGWAGALFALLAGAIQGTLVAIAVLVAKGRIEDPEAVRAEREAERAALESLEGDERRARERELALDPMMQEADEGFGKARIAFGPFLALAILEYLLLGEALVSDLVSEILGV